MYTNIANPKLFHFQVFFILVFTCELDNNNTNCRRAIVLQMYRLFLC